MLPETERILENLEDYLDDHPIVFDEVKAHMLEMEQLLNIAYNGLNRAGTFLCDEIGEDALEECPSTCETIDMALKPIAAFLGRRFTPILEPDEDDAEEAHEESQQEESREYTLGDLWDGWFWWVVEDGDDEFFDKVTKHVSTEEIDEILKALYRIDLAPDQMLYANEVWDRWLEEYEEQDDE